MPKLYFSPSDQTDNPYAVGNTNEAAQCRKIAVAAVEAAKRCGFSALTNCTDSMSDRVAESNRFGADAHIPIHTNAFNGRVAGTRLFSFDTSGAGYQLCKAILNRLAPITPGSSDSITARNTLYEVKAASAPTAYVEVAFHDNPTEAAWIIAHTADIAEAIVRGCCDYFSVAYVAPDGEPAAETPVRQLYRVRKAWSDAGSQLGAFANLENAKRLAEQNPGYAVYDECGKAVYTPARVYTVQSGDSLWRIAARQLGDGTRYKEIMTLNNLTATTIYPGQKLKLPE